MIFSFPKLFFRFRTQGAGARRTLLKGKTAPSVSEEEAEISRLRWGLAEVQMERYILKKAAACFAKGSVPGTR